MRRCPHLTFQVLTKRPQRLYQWIDSYGPPLPNLWLGVSVENQRMADERIPWLLKTPASVRFLSMEPLLEDVFIFDPWLEKICPSCGFTSHHPTCPMCHQHRVPGISWILVGGESGPRRRPMRPEWLRSIVDQCRAAQVPVFVKQDSALRPGQQGRIPDDLWIQQFPCDEKRSQEERHG
jgi:protein gp37